MRNYSLVILLFAFGSAIAQQNPTERGGAPLLDLNSDETGVTRALVIGISNFKFFRPQLQFAHRDAEVFNEYLRSKSGGELPKENIRLLTNENATLAAIDAGLNWLKKETQKGDRAIIYYAGHGDVDKETPKERGYLIAYDTPSDIYRNTAVRVEDLDDIVIQLSVKSESKAIIILDACRSGKLEKDKTNLTGKELEKQAENEVRIMACKHDQKSLEDASWGGGRGLFSYHFVNGLKGLADEGKDQLVDFDEVEKYVEDNIKKSLNAAGRGERQNPVFVGDELFKLANVDEQELAALAHEMASSQTMAMAAPPVAMGASPGRGADDAADIAGFAAAEVHVSSAVMEQPIFLEPSKPTRLEDATIDYLLKSADIKDMVLSAEFEEAMKSSEALLDYFLYGLPSHVAAEQKTALKHLLDYAQKDPKKREELAMYLVVELHNRSQEAINAYLRADANELAQRQFKDLAVEYVHYPRMLQAAILLAGPDYSLLKRMQVKQYYFDGVCDRLLLQMGTAGIDKDSPMQKQRAALKLDDRAPYVHNEIGVLFLQVGLLDSARFYFQTAVELAPNWAIPYSNLAIIYVRQNQMEKAKSSAIKALELKPDFAKARVNLGDVWMNEHNILKAEKAYEKAILADKNLYAAQERMGHLMVQRTQYMDANNYFFEAEKLKEGIIFTPTGLNTEAGQPVKMPLRERVDMDADGVIDLLDFEAEPTTEKEFLERGIYYFKGGEYEAAEPYLRRVLDFNKENKEAYDYLGRTLYHLKRYEEAELALLKLLKLRPDEPQLQLHLADVYKKQERRLEEEEMYMALLKENPEDDVLVRDIYERMDNLLSAQRRYPEQEKWLVEYAALYNHHPKLSMFYETMANQFPQNPEWLYRWAANENQYGSHWDGARLFERIMAFDTTYPAMAHMHERVGHLYENTAEAIQHFMEAIRLDSSMVAAKYELVDIFHETRQFEEAIPVLEDLLRNNQIKLPQRIQLGDLYALSGKFADADSLLSKADRFRFEPVPGLSALRGKLATYQARYNDAIRFYEAEIAQQPENMRQLNHYTLARLAALAGNQSAALTWLEKALSDGFSYQYVIQYSSEWDGLRQQERFVNLLAAHGMQP